jgi:hypothetical protein
MVQHGLLDEVLQLKALGIDETTRMHASLLPAFCLSIFSTK